MTADQEDFHAFLSEIGLTPEQIDAIVQGERTAIDNCIYLAASPIHGAGCFASITFDAGEIVAYLQAFGARTIPGRFINHSPTPNCAMERTGDVPNGIYLLARAIKPINTGDELTIDYRQVIAVNTALRDHIRALSQ